MLSLFENDRNQAIWMPGDQLHPGHPPLMAEFHLDQEPLCQWLVISLSIINLSIIPQNEIEAPTITINGLGYKM